MIFILNHFQIKEKIKKLFLKSSYIQNKKPISSVDLWWSASKHNYRYRPMVTKTAIWFADFFKVGREKFHTRRPVTQINSFTYRYFKGKQMKWILKIDNSNTPNFLWWIGKRGNWKTRWRQQQTELQQWRR